MLTRTKGMTVEAEAKPKTEEARVSITAPNFKTARVKINGTAPLVQHRFSQKAREEIRAKQAEGSTANARKKRGAKDFDALFHGAYYRSPEGWYGFPAGAFRRAMVDACRATSVKMTMAKMAINVVADGADATEPDWQLVRIEGKPRKIEHALRNDSGGADIRVRASFDKWSAVLKLEYDADMLTATDVVNLLARAGRQVGIGEGRPMSRESTGCGWGTFEVEGVPPCD